MSDEKSRKELLQEPDPFMVFVGQALDFVKTYQKQIIAAVGAVVAVAIVITGVLYYKKQAEDRAAMMFGNAIAKYNAVKNDESAFVEYEALKKEFKNISEKYGATDVGRAALLQYADLCYQTQSYDDAINAYKQALDALDQETFKTMILSGLGYAYEGKAEYQQAAKYFEMIVADDSAVFKDQALYNLGRMYEKLGNPEKEKEVLTRLVAEYPDSMFFDIAKDKIAG